VVPGKDTRATEELCFETPLLIGEDPLGLNPLMVVMPLERAAFSNVMEDGPASEMELMDADEVDDLSERGMCILSVEELCVQGVQSMGERVVEPEALMVRLSIRCRL
jgi:hypothetical protein